MDEPIESASQIKVLNPYLGGENTNMTSMMNEILHIKNEEYSKEISRRLKTVVRNEEQLPNFNNIDDIIS